MDHLLKSVVENKMGGHCLTEFVTIAEHFERTLSKITNKNPPNSFMATTASRPETQNNTSPIAPPRGPSSEKNAGPKSNASGVRHWDTGREIVLKGPM